MIRPVASLARHTLRGALRSRFVLALLLLLAVVVLTLPRTVKGDGTPQGDLRLLLTWTLGCAVFVLSVATLWAGCHSVAGESADGTLAGVAVSPARRGEILLGKWLGLALLNAVLLAAAMAATYMQIVARGIPLSLLKPYRQLHVAEESLLEHANAIMMNARERGEIPEDGDDEAWLKKIRADLEDFELSIAPGEAQIWRFQLPAGALRTEESLRARLDFTTAIGSAGEVSAICRIFDAAGIELASGEIDSEHRRRFEMSVAADKPGTSPTLAILLENTADADGLSIMVGAGHGAAVFVPQGGVARNFLMAGLALWSILAALAALGIASGALFSFPVAVFIASTLAIMSLAASSDTRNQWSEPPENPRTTTERLELLSARLLSNIAKLTRSVDEAAPLDRLGESLMVTPREALRSVAATGLLLPLLAALIATPALRQKQL